MHFTKRNHYNPCFWTALWNTEYFTSERNGKSNAGLARNQVVHALNVKSSNIFPTTVERIHYDKNLGKAEITYKTAVRFAKRYHPVQYEQFLEEIHAAKYPVYLDFEDILTAIEGLPPYQTLLRVALSESVDNLIDKSNLASFVVVQLFRSHAIMNAMIEWNEELGQAKFEYFINLKWMLSNANFLFSLVYPLVTARWQLFTSPKHVFPLCDSPVLVSQETIMVALSPRLLLEIHVSEKSSEGASPTSQRITPEKLNEYRCRTIGNTFREIIGQEATLLGWQSSSEFHARSALMMNINKYNAMIRAESRKKIWHINAYGNLG